MEEKLKKLKVLNIILTIIFIVSLFIYIWLINSNCNEYVDSEAICATGIKDCDVFNSQFEIYLENEELTGWEMRELVKIIKNYSIEKTCKHYVSTNVYMNSLRTSANYKATATFDKEGYIKYITIEKV